VLIVFGTGSVFLIYLTIVGATEQKVINFSLDYDNRYEVQVLPEYEFNISSSHTCSLRRNWSNFFICKPLQVYLETENQFHVNQAMYEITTVETL
jgi:hypothetical protein